MTEFERRSALEGVLRPGRFGHVAAGAAIVARERRPLELVQICLPAGSVEACRKAVAERLGFPLPPLNRAAGEGLRAIALGPERWLAVRAEERHGALMTELAPCGAYLCDIGHSRAVLRVAGLAWPDLMAKGCGLDFHPVAFRPGSAAQTLCAQLGVLLDAVAADAVDIYVPRSYALYFWEWLTDAALSGGYEVLPAAP